MKGAVEVMTRYMAKEFGPRGIRANAVSPGAIRTELGGGLNDEFEALLASQTALGRVGEPDDVGRVIAGLRARGARHIAIISGDHERKFCTRPTFTEGSWM